MRLIASLLTTLLGAGCACPDVPDDPISACFAGYRLTQSRDGRTEADFPLRPKVSPERAKGTLRCALERRDEARFQGPSGPDSRLRVCDLCAIAYAHLLRRPIEVSWADAVEAREEEIEALLEATED